jgi:hypothetical protein
MRNAEEFLEYCYVRNTKSLFKGFLMLVEDLKQEHESHFGKLRDALPEEYQDLINQADYLDEDKFEHLRKRVLDMGNENLRNFSTEFEKYTVSFRFNN